MFGIIAAATGRRLVIPRVPCNTPWLPRDDEHFAGIRADGRVEVVAAPCAALARAAWRFARSDIGERNGGAGWPSSLASSPLSAAAAVAAAAAGRGASPVDWGSATGGIRRRPRHRRYVYGEEATRLRLRRFRGD